eukprot:scaffold9605_cov128-Skeletonema_marinoi.AAC.2
MRKRTIRPRVPFCHSENVHLCCNKEELTVTNAHNHRSRSKKVEREDELNEQRPQVSEGEAHYPCSLPVLITQTDG